MTAESFIKNTYYEYGTSRKQTLFKKKRSLVPFYLQYAGNRYIGGIEKMDFEYSKDIILIVESGNQSFYEKNIMKLMLGLANVIIVEFQDKLKNNYSDIIKLSANLEGFLCFFKDILKDSFRFHANFWYNFFVYVEEQKDSRSKRYCALYLEMEKQALFFDDIRCMEKLHLFFMEIEKNIIRNIIFLQEKKHG